MDRTGWKWLENGWKWLEWPEMAGYILEWLEIARTGWKWLELVGMSGNCWK